MQKGRINPFFCLHAEPVCTKSKPAGSIADYPNLSPVYAENMQRKMHKKEMSTSRECRRNEEKTFRWQIREFQAIYVNICLSTT